MASKESLEAAKLQTKVTISSLRVAAENYKQKPNKENAAALMLRIEQFDSAKAVFIDACLNYAGVSLASLRSARRQQSK